MKECPFCREEIQDSAKKCRYCGEFLDGVKTVDIEKEYEKENGKGDFTNCSILKRKSFSFDPKVRCPGCGYIGKAKYKNGSYSGCMFIILLCLGIIPGIIYLFFAKSGNYVCPQCGQDHLEKL